MKPVAAILAFLPVIVALVLLVPSAARVVAARRLARERKLFIVRARLQGAPLVAEAGMVQTKSVWNYIEGKIFPTKWWPVKDHETRTFLRTQINVRLSGADRLRLLLTGSMRVYVTTYTDVEVHDAEALSNVEVHPFKESFPPLTL